MPIPSKGKGKGKRKVENEEPTGSEWSSVMMSRKGKGKVVENGSPQRRGGEAKFIDPKRGGEEKEAMARVVGDSIDERNAKSPIGRGLNWNVKPIFGNKYQLTSSVPSKHRQREPIYKDSKGKENAVRLRREMVDVMHRARRNFTESIHERNAKSPIGRGLDWTVKRIGNKYQLTSSVPPKHRQREPIYKDSKGKEDALRLGREMVDAMVRARRSFRESSDERNAKSPIGRGLDWTVKPIFGNKYQLASSVPPKHRQIEPIYKDEEAATRSAMEMVDVVHRARHSFRESIDERNAKSPIGRGLDWTVKRIGNKYHLTSSVPPKHRQREPIYKDEEAATRLAMEMVDVVHRARHS